MKYLSNFSIKFLEIADFEGVGFLLVPYNLVKNLSVIDPRDLKGSLALALTQDQCLQLKRKLFLQFKCQN